MLIPKFYAKNHPRTREERRNCREYARLNAGLAAQVRRSRPSSRDRHHAHRADRRATRQGLIVHRRFVVQNRTQQSTAA